MAYQTPITRWLVQNRRKMGLNIKEFNWSKHWPAPVFDFEAELVLNGRRSVGRGTDCCESLALEKACAEAIERVVCEQFQTSTKGVAVHSKLEAAVENSKLEALERSLFDWHLRNRIGFQPISNEGIENSTLNQWRRDHGTEVSFFEMTVFDNCRGIICLICEDGQLLLGSSCSMSRDQSIRKSLIEASRNLLTYREEPITFREAIKSNPDLWCANASYIEGFFDLFESKSTSSCRPDFDSKTELFNLQDFPSLHGCPVFAVRSTLHDRCV